MRLSNSDGGRKTGTRHSMGGGQGQFEDLQPILDIGAIRSRSCSHIVLSKNFLPSPFFRQGAIAKAGRGSFCWSAKRRTGRVPEHLQTKSKGQCWPGPARRASAVGLDVADASISSTSSAHPDGSQPFTEEGRKRFRGGGGGVHWRLQNRAVRRLFRSSGWIRNFRVPTWYGIEAASGLPWMVTHPDIARVLDHVVPNGGRFRRTTPCRSALVRRRGSRGKFRVVKKRGRWRNPALRALRSGGLRHGGPIEARLLSCIGHCIP